MAIVHLLMLGLVFVAWILVYSIWRDGEAFVLIEQDREMAANQGLAEYDEHWEK